jgi:hypothetical protein
MTLLVAKDEKRWAERIEWKLELLLPTGSLPGLYLYQVL